MLESSADLRSVLARGLGLDAVALDASRAQRLPGLTNRTCRVSTPVGEFVVRLAGPGLGASIDRRAEATNATLASAIGVGPPVVWCDPPSGALITPWLAGFHTTDARELARPRPLALAARHLRILHRSGIRFAGRVDLAAAILRHAALAGARLATASLTIGELETLVAAPAAALAAAGPAYRPCHNDPSPGNWLLRSDEVVLVDWEYAAMNDPQWDLACLAAEAELEPERDSHLLKLYLGASPAPDQVARHRLLRVMADLLAGLWHMAQAAHAPLTPSVPDPAAERLVRALAFLRDPRIGSALTPLHVCQGADPEGASPPRAAGSLPRTPTNRHQLDGAT